MSLQQEIGPENMLVSDVYLTVGRCSILNVFLLYIIV